MGWCSLRVRKFRSEDAAEVARLHRGTIRAINRNDYTPRQIRVWSGITTAKRFRDSIGKFIRFVAVENEVIVGFGDFTLDGDLAGMYVHKNWQGKGAGSALLRKIESEAKKRGVMQLEVTSTITAKTFYEQHGYKLVRKSTHMMNGVRYPVYVLKKKL